MNRRSSILLVVITATVLRLLSINQSLWLDEATSAIVVRDLGFTQIVTNFSPGDFHPPLYYLLLKVWSYGFGTSEVGLRLLSVFAGLGTVYLVYLIGKELLNKRTGLVASLLLATSGLHIYYSQEARMYALVTLFVTAAMYYFIRADKKMKRIDWILYSFSLLLSVTTFYLAVLIIPAFILYGLYKNKNASWWKYFIFSLTPLLLFLIIWSPVLYKQFNVALGAKENIPGWWMVLGKTNLKEIFLVPTKFMFGRVSVVNKSTYALLTVSVGLFYLYLFINALKNIKRMSLLWFWLIIPIAFAAFLGLFVSVFSYFRLLFVLPAIYLVLATGVFELKKKYAYFALVGILVVNVASTGIYLFSPRFHRENWRGLVEQVQDISTDNSAVLFQTSGQTEAYRYYDPDATILRAGEEFADYNQIWLVRYAQPIFDPDDLVRKNIEALEYKKNNEYDFNGVIVWEYENWN